MFHKVLLTTTVVLALTASLVGQGIPKHFVDSRAAIRGVRFENAQSTAMRASTAAESSNEPLLMIFGVFDPNHTGTIVARWLPHYGLTDPNEFDNDNYGALLSK